MESSQKFKKAIDEIEISAQLDSIVATAIERAKSEQTASSRKFLAVKKLCLAAAATLTICVGAGAAYQFYGIDRMKTADNAAASSQTETADIAVADQRRAVPSPETDPSSITDNSVSEALTEDAAGISPETTETLEVKNEGSDLDASSAGGKSGQSISSQESGKTPTDEGKSNTTNQYNLLPTPVPENNEKSMDKDDMADNGGSTPATLNELPESERDYFITITSAEEADVARLMEQLQLLGSVVQVDADDFLSWDISNGEGASANDVVENQESDSIYFCITLTDGKTQADLEQKIKELGFSFETRTILTGQD